MNAPQLAAVLAQEGERDAGPAPLLIIVLLAIATVLLIRNMSGRIKRLPREFPDQQPEQRPEDEPAP